MASPIELLYGTSNQSITITLTSLASAAARASTAVDNSTNLFEDALVFCKSIKTGASGTAATGYVNVYAYGSCDGGSTYTEGATGTDAAITLTVPPNARLIGTINTVTNADTYSAGPFSVAAAFGGTLPQHWGIIISNQSGHALDTTAGGTVFYQGVQHQA